MGDTIRLQQELANNTEKIITADLGKHLSVKELARLLHVSETKLKTSFRATYGLPIYAYSRQLRMQEAARQLLLPGETVLSVSLRLGYDNPSKFAKAFRTVTGLNPKSYQMKFR